MFCVNCGQMLQERAKFCPQCGHPLSDAAKAISGEKESLSITVAVNKNISLIQTAPYILRLDRHKCGFIKIEPNIYAQITQHSTREKEKERSFREFTAALSEKSTDDLFSGFPDSIEFTNDQIINLHIETYYNSDLHRYMDYDRFTIKTIRDKHRGSVSSDSYIMSKKNILQILFGNRFTSHETVNSFDS